MRSLLGAVAAALLLTGCATAQAAGSRAHGSAQARATALAWHLADEVRVPAGTRTAHLRSLPPDLAGGAAPSGPGWAAATRILDAPGNALAVLNTLQAHAPFNEAGGGAQIVPVTIMAQLASPEPGLDAAEVDVSVMQYNRTTTLLAVRAYVAWLPVRSAAEHLDPAGIRAVTITVQRVAYGGRVPRTLTARAGIAKLAAFLNGLRPAPQLALPCPMPFALPTVTFEPRQRHGRAIVVSVSGCGYDYVTVNGATQPSLWDENAGLTALATKLTGA
jgi:hypothetical protein